MDNPGSLWEKTAAKDKKDRDFNQKEARHSYASILFAG
jgi:hypothetical protein